MQAIVTGIVLGTLLLTFSALQTVSNINKWNQVQEELMHDMSGQNTSATLVITFSWISRYGASGCYWSYT